VPASTRPWFLSPRPILASGVEGICTHSITEILVLDAAGYVFFYQPDGSVLSIPSGSAPALPGTPVHDLDFPSKSLTMTGGLDALEATRVDAIRLLSPSSCAPCGCARTSHACCRSILASRGVSRLE